MAQEQKTERVHKFQFLGKFIIKGILECVTGTRIGGTQEKFEIGGIDNPVIKDPLTDLPYIPGSSLKGKLRSLLEWARRDESRSGPASQTRSFHRMSLWRMRRLSVVWSCFRQ